MSNVKFRKYKKLIERITIIGPIGVNNEAFEYLLEEGYKIVWSGPKPVAKYTFDWTKFRIIGEREVTK